MFRKLTLAAAAGAGYVLGAKAGKERYDQIEAKFREIAGMPAVQSATASVKDTASSLTDQAKSSVTDKVGGSSTDTSSSTSSDTGFGSSDSTSGSTGSTGSLTETDVVVVDLGTGADTGATSPLGARPSDTI